MAGTAGKFLRGLKARGMSMTALIALSIIAAAVVPLFLLTALMLQSFSQTQLDARGIDIQNQCMILSSRMSRSGYLTAEQKNNVALDSQMQSIADVYNGRIVIVGSNFKIVTDTFNLAVGKYYISPEVLRCFNGESSSAYNREMQYFSNALPIYDAADGTTVQGVMMATYSTENIVSQADRIWGSVSLLLACIIAVVVIFAVLAARLLMQPLKRLQRAFDQAALGNLDADIMVDTYGDTRRLAQSVQKSLGKLRAVDQSRQEFVSNVSHELKTPITSIRVLADSLMSMDEAPVELYREFMQDISDEIDRENQIIDDLLLLVRMDTAADSQMKVEQTNINEEMEMVLKRLRPIAKRGNVELTFESFREVTADVDRTKLSLAVTNLVENAIKYNVDSGWVRVSLDADHKYFYIKVADSGIGIPEDALDHIFERFFRVDKARSREVGGTGLGLAITKNVIQMHHGVIDVESTPGEGTTFSVRIPLNYVSGQEVRR